MLYILLRGVNGEAYNIANRESVYSIREVAEKIARIGGQKVSFSLSSKEESKGYSTIFRAVLDPSKLEHLGWEPQFSLEKGLRQILGLYNI